VARRGQCFALPNGRCRLHGGMSMGPKTPAGIDRIRRAVTKHGQHSKRRGRNGRSIGNCCGIGGRCWHQHPATRMNLQIHTKVPN
jgi:hypothetical protein